MKAAGILSVVPETIASCNRVPDSRDSVGILFDWGQYRTDTSRQKLLPNTATCDLPYPPHLT